MVGGRGTWLPPAAASGSGGWWEEGEPGSRLPPLLGAEDGGRKGNLAAACRRFWERRMVGGRGIWLPPAAASGSGGWWEEGEPGSRLPPLLRAEDGGRKGKLAPACRRFWEGRMVGGRGNWLPPAAAPGSGGWWEEGEPDCFFVVNCKYQEPITRSVQLPHIPVKAFSQTDLFLVEFTANSEPLQEPQ